MNHTTLVVCDLLLALGMTLRVTRLFVGDTLTDPMREGLFNEGWFPDHTKRSGRLDAYSRWMYQLMTCPFCIGFWVAGVVLVSLSVAGGPGDAAEPWRWVTGWWTLNYISAHIGARLGDTGDDNS